MGKTALELSPQERKAYRPADAIRRRKLQNQEVLAARREEAWRVANQAAELLKKDFGPTRVVVFGSLAHDDWFTQWSDIDLAAWGIAPSRFYQAVAAVTGISSDNNVDLVDPEACTAGLRKAIERDGIKL
jgi:predicted nucleotidyltransferase